jgi:hypothetical protein
MKKQTKSKSSQASTRSEQSGKSTTTQRSRRRGLARTLHPNRWFIWTIVLMVIIMGSLFAYITISSLNESSEQSSGLLQPRQMPTYTSVTLGVSMQYPTGWVIDNSSNTAITFDNPGNSSESITVSKATVASIAKLEKSSGLLSKSNYVNNGLQITTLTLKGPGQDQENVKVGIVQSSKSAFVVTGSSGQFTAILNSVHPLQ